MNAKFCLYKPQPTGDGAAMMLELHPADGGEDGYISMCIAPQLPNESCPTYDWKGAETAALHFTDLCRMLQVFRGECESICDGIGLMMRRDYDERVMRLQMRHVVEPFSGYWLQFSSWMKSKPEDVADVRISILPSEALGLCAAIEGAMSLVVFGVPEVLKGGC